ncbi:acyl-CoA dehydrogenase family protein [Aeromicrobium sp.]|uniref:acyl-CoA dehydrogenase family protein n=1 Tax=Aeromicrobium sp. TaxID=1871063 RepID=UPI0019A07A21|nr:acyl-CoA dehydrogenase family protein [Aeromicrobium sp.]MBC7632694.1 acyl-CoA dehydrogenase family protein [Aeromicrobium sp.]
MAPELKIWRGQVRAWLAETLPPKLVQQHDGPVDLSVFRNVSDAEETRLLEAVRVYRRARYDAGYGTLTLPVEQGGAGLSASYAIAYAQEELRFAVPQSSELISVSTGLVGPAVAMFGTSQQRQNYAQPFLRTDLLACQLFSEPGAGSDLAALACRAVRDGDEWVLDGQKVWTSGARHAEYGLLLARTDPDVPKHKGITAFLIAMDTPGLDVRPIRQMSGGSSFNEVFLSGARVSDGLRVGEVGQGWKVATTTLSFERTASGSGTRRKGGTFDDVLGLARSLGRTGDPVVRQSLADLYIRSVLKAATTERVARAAAAGVSPGPGASIGKLLASDLLVRTGDVAAELLGARVTADAGEPGQFAWTQHLLGAPGYRLAGGTDQIQRNVMAERVLGLPPEPRVDKDVPWGQLARG